jgi:hypothetical protein
MWELQTGGPSGVMMEMRQKSRVLLAYSHPGRNRKMQKRGLPHFAS